MKKCLTRRRESFKAGDEGLDAGEELHPVVVGELEEVINDHEDQAVAC